VHSKGKPLDKDVNLETLAKGTVGFSGADIANLVNEAAILSARRGKKAIGMKEFDESIDRVIAGPERRSRKISAHEKEIIAYHESGHALVAKMLPNADPVHKISIVARGMMGGYTKQLPLEDRYLNTRSRLNDVLATLMGGRVAEEIVFDEMTDGASHDIKQATAWARRMITDFGMSDRLGPRTFGEKQEMVFLGREISEQKDYGDKVADAIDEEMNLAIRNAYETARKILTENRDKLEVLAQRLIAQETLESEELEALFNEKPSRKPARRPRRKKEPVPIDKEAEAAPVARPRKAPAPKLVPKQTPAGPD